LSKLAKPAELQLCAFVPACAPGAYRLDPLDRGATTSRQIQVDFEPLLSKIPK
jgi:hypothetical protein